MADTPSTQASPLAPIEGSWNRRRQRLLAAFLVAGAAAIAVGLWGQSYDDAFITYRYAERFAAGQGLGYNPGEAVLGTTAPGWALLLGILAWLSGMLGLAAPLGIPAWGTLLSLAALLTVALLLPRILGLRVAEMSTAGLPRGASLTAAATFGILALTCRWNLELLGAEAFPILALMAGATVIAFPASEAGKQPRGRSWVAGLMVAGAMFLRLDASLGATALGLVLWGKHRSPPWRYAFAGIAPLVPWLFWLWATFGSFIPASFDGKQGEIAAVEAGYSVSEYGWLLRSFGPQAAWHLLALAAIGMAGLVLRRPPPVPALVLGLWLGFQEIFYRLVEVPFAPWYGIYGVNALLASATVGAVWLGRPVVGLTARAAQVPKARFDRVRLGITVFLAALVLLPGISWLARTFGDSPDPRYPIYQRIGEHLAADPEPGAVAAVEIGALGYYSGRPILDLVGLVSPRALAAFREGRQSELVLDEAPLYLLDVPIFRARYPVLEDPEVLRRYRTAATFEDPRSGRGTVRLLKLATAGDGQSAER